MRHDLRNIVIKIAEEWQRRMAKKPRADCLPVSFTAATLTFIQAQACFNVGATGCAYWSDRRLPDDPDDCLEGHCDPAAAEVPTEAEESGKPPCNRCQSPAVPRASLYKALLPEDHKDEEDQKRDLRRLMHGAVPMNPDSFLRAIANAWTLGWLSDTQALSLFRQVMQQRAATSVLKAWLGKLRRRVEQGEDDDGKLNCILDDVECEEGVQWASFYSMAAGRIERDRHWSAGLKQELLAALRD